MNHLKLHIPKRGSIPYSPGIAVKPASVPSLSAKPVPENPPPPASTPHSDLSLPQSSVQTSVKRSTPSTEQSGFQIIITPPPNLRAETPVQATTHSILMPRRAHPFITGSETLSSVGTIKFQDSFDQIKPVGKGSFGTVYFARERSTGKECAVKVIPKNKLQEARKNALFLEREILIGKALQAEKSPFLVQFYDVKKDAENYYLIMEFVNGQELFDVIQSLTDLKEQKIKQILAETIAGLDTLHRHHIVYRDLKPENILITKDWHAKLCDFGLSKNMDKDGKTHTFCGTPEYLAPEFITLDYHPDQLDYYISDFWSLGILLYEMLYKIPPFYDENHNKLYALILTDTIEFPDDPHVSKEAKDLILKLCEKDPHKRIGASGGIAEIKQHPFFKDIDWEALQLNAKQK